MSGEAKQPLLEARDVTLQYKTSQALITATNRVSFSVFDSDRFVLLGQSGCGKSSLLKAIAGFIKPAGGAIFLDGKSVEKPGPDRVMVFQEFDQLLAWRTVRENVQFPLISTGMSKGEAAERASEYLAKVKLVDFADTYPHMLSGGMKQRVAIARAMAMEPRILLMDEPFAALDSFTRSRMQEELLQLWEETHVTILFVTHSIEEAIRVGSRILVLSAHPGQVRAELNSSGKDGRHTDGDQLISERINGLLFADERAPVQVVSHV